MKATPRNVFTLALRDVAKAHGFSEVAKGAALGRESRYKALSPDGNPKFSTLQALLKALGLRLTVAEEIKQAS